VADPRPATFRPTDGIASGFVRRLRSTISIGGSALLFGILSVVFSRGLVAQQPRIFVLRYDDDTAIEKTRALEDILTKADPKTIATTCREILETATAATSVGDLRPTTIVVPMVAWPLEKEAAQPIEDYVTRRLAGMPSEVRDEYRKMTEASAARALDRRLFDGDTASEWNLERRLRMSVPGIRHLLISGHEALERGDADLAQRSFEDVLELTALDHDAADRRRAALTGLALAAALRSDRETVDSALGELRELSAQDPDEKRREAAARLLSLVREPPRSASARSANSALDADTPRHECFADELESAWTYERPHSEAALRRGILLPEVVTDGKIAFYYDPDRYVALDLATGAVKHAVLFGEAGPGRDIRPGDPRWQRFARPAVGDGRAFFTLARSGERELCAVDLADGKVLWRKSELFDDAGQDAVTPHVLIDSAPLLAGQMLFVTAVEAAPTPRSYAAALDAATGRTIWATNFGSGIPISFQSAEGDVPDPSYWVGAMPSALIAGFLLVGDNLGTIACLERDTGWPRSTYRYPRRGSVDDRRTTGVTIQRGFESNGIVADGARFAAAPDDADRLFVFHVRPPRDPKRLAEARSYVLGGSLERRRFRRIAGMVGETVYMIGTEPHGSQAIVDALAPGADERFRSWPSSAPLDSAPLTPGALEKKGLYVATERYVFRVDLGVGDILKPVLARESDGPKTLGYLKAADGGFLSASEKTIEWLRPKPPR
jgi:outer membrane protein assembly factor BamB